MTDGDPYKTVAGDVSPARPDETVPATQLAVGGNATTLDFRPAAAEAAAPTVVGDYEIVQEIARGGMGVVYKARQVSLNRLVAVKKILSGQFASPDDVRRFRAEAEAAAQLRHPNIVAIYEVGERGGQHFFSMEYVPGRSLAQMVREHPLAPKRAARYVKTVAAAIHYAHGQGILHRDLKPSNVLIDETDQPRVTDFGLAKRLGSENDKLYKFAFSSPIRRPDTDDPPLGVLVATVATDSSFGLPYLNDEHRKAALVGPLDPPRGAEVRPRTLPDDVILVHPAYAEPGKRAVAVESGPLRGVRSQAGGGRRDDSRREPPVAGEDAFYDPLFGGRWLAAFAPVPDSEFVVIVEQRYEDAVRLPGSLARQLLAWAGTALTLAVVLLGASIGYALLDAARRK